MIISASRRTDIPAFYSQWFMNRVRAGFCTVPNPFNPRQVSVISLQPEDVEVMVFWTRFPRPFFSCLRDLDALGYRYYFLFTLTGYPRALDVHGPHVRASIRAFQELSDRLGPERVVWRYDPIVFSKVSGLEFHRRNLERLAGALKGRTSRVVISFLDEYQKIQKRMRRDPPLLDPIPAEDLSLSEFDPFMKHLVEITGEYGIRAMSCAENFDLSPYGVTPGKCIDDVLIERAFGIKVSGKKDPSQRKACGCVVSRDVGMYDSCLFGCRYCYATSSFKQARKNFQGRHPDSPSLLGWHDPLRVDGPGNAVQAPSSRPQSQSHLKFDP